MRVPTVIKTLGDPFSGLSGKTKEDFGHGDASYITFLNVLSNPTINPAAFEKVDVLPNEKQNLCKKGDLFFNTSSETPEEVGMCSCLNIDYPRLYLNSFCFGFRLKDPDSADSQFLAYYFRGKEGRQLMTMLAQGSTRYNLSKEYFLDSTIEIPLVDEQRQIVEALSSIDKLINNLSRTIAKKENMRDGAMEELLSGKRRLPGFTKPWEEKLLVDILNYEQPGAYLVCDTNYQTSGVPVLTAGKTFILGYTSDKSGIFSNVPCIIFDDFTTESRFVNFAFKAKSSAMKMLHLKNSDNDLKFISYIMMQLDFHPVDHQRHWIGIYSLLSVFIPSDIKEQYAIADTLTAMDDEIQVMKIEKEKYEQIRSGMMDDLLSGKIRLK